MEKKVFKSDKFFFKYMYHISYVSLFLFIALIAIDALPSVSFTGQKVISGIRVFFFFVAVVIWGIGHYHNRLKIVVNGDKLNGYDFKQKMRLAQNINKITAFGTSPAGKVISNIAFKNIISYYITFTDGTFFELAPKEESLSCLNEFLSKRLGKQPEMWS